MNKLYEKVINENKVKPKVLINCIKAFMVGGFISVIGQGLLVFYKEILELSKEDSISLMVVSLILVATILTVTGIYDKIGQFAGAGSIIPITGFANSMTSSAMESKSEGLVLGIGPNMFKLAGSVIVFGVVSAYFFGLIRLLIEVLM